jgi:UDP-glucuronate decarboxylase
VLSLTNSTSQLIFKPLPADDPRQRKPDTTFAEAATGWRATTPLAEGLKHTIAYFEHLMSTAEERVEPVLQLRTA